MRPSVAIILVNYNGFSDTVECIKSLNEIHYDNYKIFVVDNASTTIPKSEELCFIKENCFYIELEQNLGFSAGNNIGIKAASEKGFDYVLLLNNDTVVTADFLNIMMVRIREIDDLGAATCRINFYFEKKKTWYGGGIFDDESGLVIHEKYDEISVPISNSIRKISFITGCLMLIPISTIKLVGLMSEDYFLYAEDSDYSCRILNQGLNLYYVDDALIYHKVSSSTGAGSKAYQYYLTRNNLRIVRLYSKHKVLNVYKFAYRALKDIVRGRMDLMPVIHGYIDFLFNKYGKI